LTRVQEIVQGELYRSQEQLIGELKEKLQRADRLYMGKQEAWEKAQSKVDLELREVRGRKEGLEGEMRGELRSLALRCEDLVGRLREGESERESLLSETRRLRADKEQLYRKVVDAQNDLEKQKAIALENHLAASLGDS
jgi:hypothetical protein